MSDDPNQPSTVSKLRSRWQRLNHRLKKLILLSGLTFVGGAMIMGIAFLILTRDLPTFIRLEDYRPPIVTQLIAKQEDQSVVIGEFFKERRYIVPYERIPRVVVNAFLAAEDDQFFSHPGISFVAILRAAIANFRAGHVVQGGSTITQQVAKSLFLSPERSFVRKFKEAVLAYRIESNLTKEQILYLYLNQIYLGFGAYGVQAAAKAYFRKDISELTLPEAALLAGMTQAPSKYHPVRNPTRAKERQRYVLRRMHETQFIARDEMETAIAAPLKIFRPTDTNFEYAPYLVEHIRRYLIKTYGEKGVYEDGLTVYVPSRPDLMKRAREYIRDGLRQVSKRRGFLGPIAQLATDNERQEFIAKSAMKILNERVDWNFLTVDSEIVRELPQTEGEQKPFESFLNENELYEALVQEVDDQALHALVQIGNEILRLPMEKMEWARAISEDSRYLAPAPKRPSRVLKPGDVVLVRVLRAPTPKRGRSQKTDEQERWIASLEQNPEVQGGLFSIDAETGYVLAMIGGYDFKKSEFNRVVQAERQPGSAFKPIIFSMALEKGYTPASIIVDSPIIYKDEEFGKWKPTNFKERFYGDTTFRLALIKSRNIPTIKIVQKLQVPTVISAARRLGMTGAFNEDLSISLGSATTTLKELTEVYALFPRQGRKVRPIFFTKVLDREGLVLEEHLSQEVGNRARIRDDQQKEEAPEEVEVITSAQAASPYAQREVEQDETGSFQLPNYPPEDDPDQVMDPRVAYVMTHLLREVVEYGTGGKAKVLKRLAAGKTGTTNDYKDAWFIGFTPNIVTGAWVGFDDASKSMGRGETGSGAALPIWTAYMKDAIELYPEKDFIVPPGIVFAAIDDKGRRVDQTIASAREEAFIAGTEPKEQRRSRRDSIDSESEFLKEDFQ